MNYEIPKRLTDELAVRKLESKRAKASLASTPFSDRHGECGQEYAMLQIEVAVTTQRLLEAEARVQRFRDILEAVEIVVDGKELLHAGLSCGQCRVWQNAHRETEKWVIDCPGKCDAVSGDTWACVRIDLSKGTEE